MKLNYLFLFTLLVLVLFSDRAFADPSASTLLAQAKSNTTLNCNTHHIIYSTTTVMQKPGQQPVTMIQTTELFKKKPNEVKMIINNGQQQQVAISFGDGYVYYQDPNSGKFQPIKSPFPIDPFQDFPNQLSNFNTATAAQVGDHYEVTLKGGAMPATMDHATVKLDPTASVVTHMEGQDANGNIILSSDMTYQTISNTQRPKTIHTESHTNNFDVTADMNVVDEEINQPIADSVFAIK